MKVWVIQIGEPIPSDDDGRAIKMRASSLAEKLAEKGHDVTYWTTDFYHQKKKFRKLDQTKEIIFSGVKYKFLKSIGYKKNICLRRLWDHFIHIFYFLKESKREEKPDVIFCSFPTIELSFVSLMYALRHNIPFIVDVRDLWPEIFYSDQPVVLKQIIKILSLPYSLLTKVVLKKASALCTITPQILKYLQNKHGLPQSKQRTYFYLAKKAPRQLQNLTDAKISTLSKCPVFVFAGTLGNNFNVHFFVEFIGFLENRGKPYKVILCGDGPIYGALDCLIKKHGWGSVQLKGWVDTVELSKYLREAHFGLSFFIPSNAYLMSVSNKSTQYLAFGLPILTNLSGTLGELIISNQIGSSSTNASELVLYTESLQEKIKSYEVSCENAFNTYLENFDDEKVSEAMASFVESNCAKFSTAN